MWLTLLSSLDCFRADSIAKLRDRWEGVERGRERGGAGVTGGRFCPAKTEEEAAQHMAKVDGGGVQR